MSHQAGRAASAPIAATSVLNASPADDHTFQPLLHQLATGLLETRPSATRCATAAAPGQHQRPQGQRDGVDWAGTTLTHQRVGRITLFGDE